METRRSRGTGRWRELQSQKRMKGVSYVTRTSKALKPAKRMTSGIGVDCSCKHQCKRLTLEAKLKLFQAFYNENSKSQGTFLMSNIKVARIRRRRHGKYDEPADSRRQATIIYSVPGKNGETLRVCKKNFINIFDVSAKKLRVLTKRVKEGLNFFSDRRTATRRPSKYSDEVRNKVWSHIKSLPTQESHYSRMRSNKLYLNPDLNMNRLHQAFIKQFPECNFVSYVYYRNIFKRDFPNYSFSRPRTDTCRTCDVFAAKIKASNNDLLKARLQRKLEQHHLLAEKATKALTRKMTSSKLPGCRYSCMAIDLQQVMFVPTLTHSDMFYQRQLSCYNLGVNIGDLNQSYMCMWSEFAAGRGGNEIISCLFHILNDPSIIQRRKISIWSDNCVGQNKNQMAVMAYLFLVANGTYDCIQHEFLVSGHSFLPCDRDFALIEKRKRVTKSFIPSDLHEVVLSAKLSVPFKVIDMEDKAFFDFKLAAKQLLDANKLQIKKVSGIKITRNSVEKGIVFTRNKIHGAWIPVYVLKKRATVEDVRAITLTSTSNQCKISNEKKKDLLSMLDYLPDEKYKNFYMKNLA